MKERSLVAFTILSQMAVGAFWTLVMLHTWVARQAGMVIADELTTPALLAIGPVMALAMLASFFHLGTPINAWRAFANLRSSWLSREILFAVLFTGASILFAGLQWFEKGTPDARTVVAGVVALIGLALIVSMAIGYQLRTIPAWNTLNTPTLFSITALLLGGLGVGVTLVLDSGAPPELLRTVLQWIALGTMMLLGVELAMTTVWIADLATDSEAAVSSLTKMAQGHRFIFRLRLALAVLGMVSAGIALSPWWQWPNARIAIILAFGLVLTSEVLGRLLFYEARVRHGV